MTIHTEIQRTDGIGPSRVTINNNFEALENYIHALIADMDWVNSVLTFTDEGSAVQTTGNRYIADSTAGGWTEDNIYEWDGSTWIETIAAQHLATWVEDETLYYIFTSIGWGKIGNVIYHNDLFNLQGGSTTQRNHLSLSEKTDLTGNQDAQLLHSHNIEVSVPENDWAPGTRGQWAFDGVYYYFCVATDEWIRYAVETEYNESSSSSSAL